MTQDPIYYVTPDQRSFVKGDHRMDVPRPFSFPLHLEPEGIVMEEETVVDEVSIDQSIYDEITITFDLTKRKFVITEAGEEFEYDPYEIDQKEPELVEAVNPTEFPNLDEPIQEFNEYGLIKPKMPYHHECLIRDYLQEMRIITNFNRHIGEQQYGTV